MMARKPKAAANPLQLCLDYRTLLEKGRVLEAESLLSLIQAGIAARDGRWIVLEDYESLHSKIESQCSKYLQAAAEAERLAEELGFSVRVDEWPQEALLLLQTLRETEEAPGPTWQQQLSASLYGDSKLINRTPVLRRLYEAWRNAFAGHGEIRLKASSPLVHMRTGLDLARVTHALGQAVILHSSALPIEEYDFSGIPRVVTCENLSPFIQLSPLEGLFIYSRGYASNLVCAWLSALPDSCEWVHFGDFDCDGLKIFGDIMERSGRTGRFFPDLPVLNRFQSVMIQGQTGDFRRLRGHGHHQIAELALWGETGNLRLEQETLLAHASRSDVEDWGIGLRLV
jgi:hypothetical protein